MTTNPSPNVKVKSYLLKVALYEGVELPTLKKYTEFQIVASCGPYEVASKMVKCKDARAIWNEYLELNIRAPDVQDDIPDVILYLQGDSSDALSRVSFKRIKAATLLDCNGKAFDIQNYILEEDKSIDALDDEQFPGII